MKNRWSRMGIVILIMLLMGIGYGGFCKKDKDKDTVAASSTPATSTTITLSGTLDGSSAQFVAVPQNGFFDKFCKLFSLPEACAVVPNADISKIFSITYDQTGLSVTQAITNGDGFFLSLKKGNPYIIVFVGGTTEVLGLLKLDAATDLDALPLSNISGNIALGTVSYDGSEFTGTINQTDLFNALGITSSFASALGAMDEGMMRWCSLDVDQDQVLDFTQNREYQLSMAYQFRSQQVFDDITGTNFSVYSQTTFTGYQYNVSIAPYETLFDFDYATATATMRSPADINGGNDKTNGYVGSDPYPGGGNYAIYEFYSGEPITDPYTPPQGTYTITITDSTAISNRVYTFFNVSSQTIISPTLYDVYIPSVKLTVVGGQVTKLEWKWWKNTPSGWVNPSAEELDAVMADSNCTISNSSTQMDSQEVRGQIASPWEGIPFATEGSVNIPAQDGWTASDCAVNYFTKSGYEYHFEWNTNNP